MRSASIAFIAILCAALVSPASADNDKNKGHGHGGGGGPKAEKNDNDHGRGNNAPTFDQRAAPGSVVVVPYHQVVIVDGDRDRVRSYYRTEYVAGRCPPGLAKKNNGCMPPGLVNRAWVVGQPLPPEVAYYPIQRELWVQLTPPPYGYEYAQVNDDIVLIATATRVIAGLLGNLGNFDN
jgi:Ni/Co efflux regulator RcnB